MAIGERLAWVEHATKQELIEALHVYKDAAEALTIALQDVRSKCSEVLHDNACPSERFPPQYARDDVVIPNEVASPLKESTVTKMLGHNTTNATISRYKGA